MIVSSTKPGVEQLLTVGILGALSFLHEVNKMTKQIKVVWKILFMLFVVELNIMLLILAKN